MSANTDAHTPTEEQNAPIDVALDVALRAAETKTVRRRIRRAKQDRVRLDELGDLE
jgi:hypothetical protein